MMTEDNVDAILITNANKMTERSRRIDIQYQYYAIQEWISRKQVNIEHIPGVINPANALTKNLGWVLHQHNLTEMMGYCGSWYTNTPERIP